MKCFFFSIIKFILFILACFILAISWPFILLFNKTGYHNVMYARLMHYLFKTIFFAQLQFIDLEKIDPNKNYIYVCNHQSFFDVILISFIFPKNSYIIAKDSLKYIPFFGQLYILSGNFYIKRGNSQKAKITMSRVIEKIKLKKSSIFILPQGTRCPDNQVKKLKRGFIQLAKDTQSDILPFVISSYKMSDIICHFKNKIPIKLKVYDKLSYQKEESELLLEVKNLMNSAIHELDTMKL